MTNDTPRDSEVLCPPTLTLLLGFTKSILALGACHSSLNYHLTRLLLP